MSTNRPTRCGALTDRVPPTATKRVHARAPLRLERVGATHAEPRRTPGRPARTRTESVAARVVRTVTRARVARCAARPRRAARARGRGCGAMSVETVRAAAAGGAAGAGGGAGGGGGGRA